MKRYIFYKILIIVDHIIWVFINILPGNLVLLTIRKRPWFFFNRLKLSKKSIIYFIRKRCSTKIPFGSSCLSRAILTRIILDLCRIPNDLSIGMTKNKKNIKIAHAWVSDPKDGFSYTPGLEKNGVFILNL